MLEKLEFLFEVYIFIIKVHKKGRGKHRAVFPRLGGHSM